MKSSTLLKYLASADAKLGSIIEKINLEQFQSSNSIFEDLVSCILDMQIKYRGNATRYKRLKECTGNKQIVPNTLFTLSVECQKFINMSRQKFAALNSLADYWTENNYSEIDWHNKSDDEIRSLLVKIKGIGNWTVDMILLYTLQRQDIFPIDDFQLKKSMKKVYEIDESENLKKEMQYIADDWKPFRSTAVLYLIENAKKS
jgi:DNA-3-methyladenine glycosylase II